jgi:glutamate racemase
LSVLKALHKLLPDEHFLYIADTARLPYGSRSIDEVIEFSCQMIHLAIGMGAKMVLIACNTSASSLPKEWYKRFSVPILNIVDPLEEIIGIMGKRVAIMATPLTIDNGIYQKMISEKDASIQIIGIPCPMLVPVVENDVIPLNGVSSVLWSYLVPILDMMPTSVVYGCSHYVFLDQEIREILGYEVRVLDPAQYFAQFVAKYILDGQLEKYRQNTRLLSEYMGGKNRAFWKKESLKQMNALFYVTGDPFPFAHSVNRLLGFKPYVQSVVFDN